MINNGTRPAIVQEKREKYKIKCSFAAGSTVYIYPDELQMKKTIYNENLKRYQTVIVDASISDFPEDERDSIIDDQKKLMQRAIEDFNKGKIDRIFDGLI